MAAKYFSGKTGNFVIQAFDQNIFRMSSWNYVKDKGLVDISNTNAFGVEQYIGNLNSGSIQAEGLITDELLDLIINNNALQVGDEILVDLWVDEAALLGFQNLNAIVDDFTFDLGIDTAATYVLKALISEPKL